MDEARWKVTPGKICWLMGIALIAGAATGLQVDREGRNSELVAQMVPSAFRAYASETLARKAYASGDNKRGLAYSRELLLRRPVPAEGLSLLTMGLLRSEKREEALNPLLLSAQRGWRDRFTQHVLASAALQMGDAEIATQRILALWRLGERDTETQVLTQKILSSRNGLAAFHRAVVTTDTWNTELLTWGSVNIPSKSLDVIASALAKKNVDVDCGQISGVVQRLARSGKVEESENIWLNLCSTAGISSSQDYGFKISNGEPGPFDWVFPDHPGLSTEIIQEDGIAVLEYEYAEQIRVIIARRNATLSSGQHAVRIEYKTAKGTGLQPVSLQITCFSESGSANKIASVHLGGRRNYFEVPSSGCAVQDIALIVAHGRGSIQRLLIDQQ